MPKDATELELDQVVTFLTARGWTVLFADRLTHGLRIDARRDTVTPPYPTEPLRDLTTPGPHPRR